MLTPGSSLIGNGNVIVHHTLSGTERPLSIQMDMSYTGKTTIEPVSGPRTSIGSFAGRIELGGFAYDATAQVRISDTGTMTLSIHQYPGPPLDLR
ncbi:MAG: hypothetical protein WBP64_19945 [Nitrososphaeraceae archaeon]